MVMDLDTKFVNRFNNKEFRKALRADPKTVMREYAVSSGWQPDDEAEFVIKTNTKDTFYVAIPHSNANDLLLASIAAADDTIHLSSALCGSTVTLTVSTFGSHAVQVHKVIPS